MADAKKEYKDFLKLLEAQATATTSANKFSALGVDAQDPALQKWAPYLANWLRKRSSASNTNKARILTIAERMAKDSDSDTQTFGRNVLGMRDYCLKEIASVVPDWHTKALAAGWVPDWEAAATKAGWTRPSPSPSEDAEL